MLIAGAPTPREEVRREDLHVAGEDEQVDLAAEQLQHPRLRRVRAAVADRHVVVGEAQRGDLVGVVGMVGDDGDDLGAQLAAAPAPEQVGEAVVFARDHDRHPLALARLGEAVLHPQRPGELLGEAPVERLPLPLRGGIEGHPHEEPPLAARVLVGVDDVAAGVGEEAADRGDQPRLIRAGEQQARGGGLAGDAGMIAVRPDDRQRDTRRPLPNASPHRAARRGGSARSEGAGRYLVTVSVPYMPCA